jgi:hypothetical protein
MTILGALPTGRMVPVMRTRHPTHAVGCRDTRSAPPYEGAGKGAGKGAGEGAGEAR